MKKQLSSAITMSLIVGACSSVTTQGDTQQVKGNPDFSTVTKAIDVNGDGKMTREEWLNAGAPESAFNMFENGRGYVTQEDYDTNAAPAGIDLNNDGRLTLAEFIEFDAKGPGNTNAEQRPTISAAERAVATIHIQNLMSRHEYYHAAGLNLKEVEDLWVSEHGANARTAVFFSPGWVMQGIATIKGAYGKGHESDKVAAFKELQKIYPELAGINPEIADIGGEFAMHTSTTPIIEIAGDGKTAKGYFYSPGIGLMPHVDGHSVQVGGIFFWEKYAADFIKENNEWKIWHLGMSYDYTPPLPDSMTANLGSDALSAQGNGPGAGAPPKDNREKGEKMTKEEIAAGGMLPQPYPYQAWSPTRKNLIDPILPEPYYTFSETFSYAPYDDNNYHNPKFYKSYNEGYYSSLTE